MQIYADIPIYQFVSVLGEEMYFFMIKRKKTQNLKPPQQNKTKKPPKTKNKKKPKKCYK